jgi:hypothetical protein
MDARDPTTGDRAWVRWRRSTSRRSLAVDEGDAHGEVLGAREKAQTRLGRRGELDSGLHADAGAPKSAGHGEAG